MIGKTRVNVHVYSDTGNQHQSELQFILLAEHREKRNFQKDWDKCLEEVRKYRPEYWNVGDVQQRMAILGWVLTREVTKTVEVSY
jgi:hypothetical protein